MQYMLLSIISRDFLKMFSYDLIYTLLIFIFVEYMSVPPKIEIHICKMAILSINIVFRFHPQCRKEDKTMILLV